MIENVVAIRFQFVRPVGGSAFPSRFGARMRARQPGHMIKRVRAVETMVQQSTVAERDLADGFTPSELVTGESQYEETADRWEITF